MPTPEFRAVSIKEQRAAKIRVRYRRFLSRRGIPGKYLITLDLPALKAFTRAIALRKSGEHAGGHHGDTG